MNRPYTRSAHFKIQVDSKVELSWPQQGRGGGGGLRISEKGGGAFQVPVLKSTKSKMRHVRVHTHDVFSHLYEV